MKNNLYSLFGRNILFYDIFGSWFTMEYFQCLKCTVAPKKKKGCTVADIYGLNNHMQIDHIVYVYTMINL